MALIPYFDALKIAGSLSSPSKMPCPAYGLPASKCKAGGELAKLEGSTCSQCYAKKGNYRWVFHVRQVQSFRLRAIRKPTWVAAMVSLIVNQSLAYFRWHDSGDLQSLSHLRKIVKIAETLPVVKFWLPTSEHRLVAEYSRRYGPFPSNLTVRLSATLIDGPVPASDLPVSSVYTQTVPSGAHDCRARFNANRCGACRACWDPNVKHVAYPLH